jgi:hypothetical protein
MSALLGIQKNVYQNTTVAQLTPRGVIENGTWLLRFDFETWKRPRLLRNI